MEETVKKEPIIPADWQRAIDATSLKIFTGSFTLYTSLQI